MARISECLRLAELTCARLCHDLSGLLGTIGGALELATDGDQEPSEEVTLAADAALMARGPRPAGLPDLGPGVTVDGWFALGAMLDARAGSSSAEILAAAFDDQATAAELRSLTTLVNTRKFCSKALRW